MAEARTRRIESEIQRVLSELISREVKDPRVGNVTITAVSLAADMGVAKVFFTPFASRNPVEEVQVGMTQARGADAHEDLAGPGLGVGYVTHFRRLLPFHELQCAQCRSPRRSGLGPASRPVVRPPAGR